MTIAAFPTVRTDLPGRFNELDVLRRQRDRYELAMAGEVVPPYEVMVHPSSICNLRCDWCIGDHVPVTNGLLTISASKFESEKLPDDIGNVNAMRNLIGELIAYQRDYKTASGEPISLGVETVNFSGLIGDPLIRKDAVFEAVDMLRDAGRRVGCFTSGTLIKAPDFERIGRMSFIHLSLDAARPETYAELKYQGRSAGEGLFRRAVDNLNTLGDKARSDGWPVQIAVGFVTYPQNYKELYEVAKIAKLAGAHVLKIKRDISCLHLLGRDERAQAQALIDQARADFEDDFFSILQIHAGDSSAEPVRMFSKCRITQLMASVGSDGRLYPCNYHPRVGGTHYGSVIHDGFVNCWEGSLRAETMPHLPEICPPTCDPFKGRSNTLFEQIEVRRAEVGDTVLAGEIDQLISGQVYEVAHPTE